MSLPSIPELPAELSYIALLFALFVIPKILVRYRLPSAITCFALGALSGMVFHRFTHDATVELLSTFGIVSLFLFAGLEVDLEALRREKGIILQHLGLRLVVLAATTFGLRELVDLSTPVAALTALALLTPSTGFILSAVGRLDVDERARFWIESKAIAAELLALAVLFVTLQSTTATRLALSASALLAMIILVPLAFHAFAKFVVPHAPRSEFAFLIMVSVVCAFATRSLGVYYLVGAFVVGMAAQNFRRHLPALASENMLHAVEAFASIFVPFYFFHAGLLLQRSDFDRGALLAGVVFLIIFLPLRIAVIALHRRVMMGEPFGSSLKVGVPMLPTLVFTLVVAQILKDRFEVPSFVFGGLIVYTIANTLIPGFFLHVPPPEFEEPHMLPLEFDGQENSSGA